VKILKPLKVRNMPFNISPIYLREVNMSEMKWFAIMVIGIAMSGAVAGITIKRSHTQCIIAVVQANSSISPDVASKLCE